MPIKIELWDWRSSGNHLYLGETQMSVNEFKTLVNSNRVFQNKEKKKVGTLRIQQFELI